MHYNLVLADTIRSFLLNWSFSWFWLDATEPKTLDDEIESLTTNRFLDSADSSLLREVIDSTPTLIRQSRCLNKLLYIVVIEP